MGGIETHQNRFQMTIILDPTTKQNQRDRIEKLLQCRPCTDGTLYLRGALSDQHAWHVTDSPEWLAWALDHLGLEPGQNARHALRDEVLNRTARDQWYGVSIRTPESWGSLNVQLEKLGIHGRQLANYLRHYIDPFAEPPEV